MEKLPESIRKKVERNPNFKARQERREKARQKGRTLPPGELPKGPHSSER